MESNNSPEIPDRGETSDIPGLPSGDMGKREEGRERGWGRETRGRVEEREGERAIWRREDEEERDVKRRGGGEKERGGKREIGKRNHHHHQSLNREGRWGHHR